MSAKVIQTPDAPAAIGPYSQAIQTGEFLFISGQIPIDPQTGLMAGSIQEQAQTALNNIAGILKAASFQKTDIVKTTVFLTTMDHFSAMNEVYQHFFDEHKPARSTIAVAGLPKNASIEIEAIAHRKGK